MSTPAPSPAAASPVAATEASPRPRYDLRSLLRRTGRVQFGALSFPEERADGDAGVELIEDQAERITEPAAPVWAFLDGIQNQMLLGYRSHRPVVLAYVAAGAAAAGPQLLAVRERLAVVCAEDELGWVATVNTDSPAIPVATVPSGPPPEVATAVLERVQTMRAGVEADLRHQMLEDAAPGSLIVLDGSLQGAENDPRLVGVVKSSRTRYLADETVLYGLPAGWRSPIFKIPSRAGNSERYSCYVRLHDAAHSEWSFGMVRLEAFDPHVLPALASRAMVERQGPASGDGRWDRHLTSVATCERLLRVRRPMVFDLFKN